MQKPVHIARTVEEAGDHLNMAKPNAAVKDKSSQAEFDVNAQQVEAIQSLAGRMRKESVEARTGNAMVDQFVPWYFSVACGFIFI